jgi:hypothetical protein
MTFIKDKAAYKTARLLFGLWRRIPPYHRPFHAQSLWSLNMLSKDSSIETAKNTADNLIS